MPSNELMITDEELLAATGEDQQQGGTGLIKYVKLLQKHAQDVATNYKNLIELHPEQKAKLQAEMLVELDKQIPLGSYVIKDGKDEFGDILKSIGKPFIGQILKTRYSWATKMLVEPAYHTSEVDTQGGWVDVFNDANEKIDSLPGTMLKEKYPDLKMQNQLYVYEPTSRSLYKLAVRGGSFTNWFEYLKTFPKGVSKASFETIFDSEKLSMKDPKSGVTNEYYAMTFKRGSAIEDKQTTIQMIRELNALLGVSHVSKAQEDGMLTPSEVVAALTAPKETITASTTPPKAITQQKLVPGVKERKRMIDEASAKVKLRETDMSAAPEFLQPDKE